MVVVVVVEGALLAMGAAAPGGSNCALFSSDQSTVPLPLPSTLAKAASP